MNFLIDAQLPRRLSVWLTEVGHDARHTLDLPSGNRTPDSDIIACAMRENRVVATKDGDFVQSFLLTGYPTLLLISTGNITNVELQRLLHANLREIELAFAEYRFVEITRDALVIHE